MAPFSNEETSMVKQVAVANFVPTCLHFVSKPPSLQNNVREIHDAISRTFQNLLDELSRHPVTRAFQSLSSQFNNHILQVRREWSVASSEAMRRHNFAAVLPGDSVAGLVVANGISSFLNLYNTLLVARLVLTWFPNAPPVIVSPLSTLCDPYLNIFRGIIPPLGGTLDLSPILAFLVLNLVSSSAEALPAELPQESPPPLPSDAPTSMQEKWLKRLNGRK